MPDLPPLTRAQYGLQRRWLVDENARVERFDQVWQKVEDDYLYRDFGGLDWATIREEYRPQALAAASSEEFYAVIKQMIQRLEDRHSRYLTPQEAQQQKAVTGGTEAATDAEV